jgi:hypothetical protein
VSSLVASVFVLVAACSSADPEACASKGSYAGADTCGKLKAAWDAKCSSLGVFDCNALLAGTPCNPQKSFCKQGVDQLVTDVNAATDCAAVKANVVCF